MMGAVFMRHIHLGLILPKPPQNEQLYCPLAEFSFVSVGLRSRTDLFHSAQLVQERFLLDNALSPQQVRGANNRLLALFVMLCHFILKMENRCQKKSLREQIPVLALEFCLFQMVCACWSLLYCTSPCFTEQGKSYSPDQVHIRSIFFRAWRLYALQTYTLQRGWGMGLREDKTLTQCISVHLKI